MPDIKLSKDELFSRVRPVLNQWHRGTRQGNDGNAGHAFEDLIGVEENNLSLPDFGEIEIKTQRVETSSLLTLFHKDPQPSSSVPNLLRTLGWQHKKAGADYPDDEMSFRSTTRSDKYSDRGLTIELNQDRINLIFNPDEFSLKKKDRTKIYSNYGEWLDDILSRDPNYQETFPVYWDRKTFEDKCIEKLNKTLFVTCKTRKETEESHIEYKFLEAYLYSGFLTQNLEQFFSEGGVFIDFDARTRHNHGTKLRIKTTLFPMMFEEHEKEVRSFILWPVIQLDNLL